MKVRPLLLLLASTFFLPLPGRGASPFGPDPPLVQPGPPRIPVYPDRRLPWRVFTWRDGIRSGTPPFAEDTQGYVWADGPARYDGRTWQRFEIPGETVPEQIWSLLAASDGSLWFGRTVGGVRRLHEGAWTWYAPGAGVPSGAVNTIVEEDRRTVWVGTEARAVYNRLPRGEYTFHVWGLDGEGVVSGPAAVHFRIRPAPWLSAWAIALYALALIGIGYGGNHVHTLSRRATTLEAQVAERTRELAEANRQLELATLTDPLTGLHNRRFLSLGIEPDVRQAVRNAQGGQANGELIFYFLDIDHFKQLNDRAGHAAGDKVLVELATRLREAARTTDAVLRLGARSSWSSAGGRSARPARCWRGASSSGWAERRSPSRPARRSR